ncbi:MAG: histidinol-phosphate aminotransferase family protein, partial [Acidobacteriaceae bacterium]|nr:histidinol-phosphate aminotransferase family protein [Acidobacteriaceae bacterium]
LLCGAEPLTVLNGASQVYPTLAAYFRGRRTLLPAPTFGEYARCFPQAGNYPDNGTNKMDEIAARARDAEMVVFVNPNNPTGTGLSSEAIYSYAASHPAQTVVCDESFIEFSCQPSLVGILEESPLENVIVIKSMSKTLGVPGIRLGYVYTRNVPFRQAVRQTLPVWNLNSIAEHFLEVILKHRGAIEESYRQTINDRNAFAAGLAALDPVKTVWPSGGNFLLVELDRSAQECAAITGSILLNRGIYLKDVSHRLPGSRAYLRLAVRLPEENDRLIDALRSET